MTKINLNNNSPSNVMIQDLQPGDWFTFPNSDNIYIFINNSKIQSYRINDNTTDIFERDERCIRLSMVNISFIVT